MIEVLLNYEIDFLVPSSLERIIHTIVRDHGIVSAEISLVIVDDTTIHRLNRDHLQHDYPTDVLSFVLEKTDVHLDGEIIVSADTATRVAAECGWAAQDELLLYFIHGCLHLVGYDDHCDEDRADMRAAEAKYLRQLNLTPPDVHHDRMSLSPEGPRS